MTSTLRLLLLMSVATVTLPLTLAADDKPKTESTAAPDELSKQKPRTLFDGKTLKGWRVLKKFDFEEHGKVKVEKGAIVLRKGSPATGVAWTGKMPRMNYEVTLEAKRVEGSDFFCGMTFPVGKSYCSLIVGGWGGGVTGLSNIDDASAVENETTGYSDFKQDKWYRVRLRVTPTKIEAWLDKDQIVDVDAKNRKFSIWWEQEPVRPFGVAAWNTSAAIRNVKLQQLATDKNEKKAGKQKKEN